MTEDIDALTMAGTAPNARGGARVVERGEHSSSLVLHMAVYDRVAGFVVAGWVVARGDATTPCLVAEDGPPEAIADWGLTLTKAETRRLFPEIADSDTFALGFVGRIRSAPDATPPILAFGDGGSSTHVVVRHQGDVDDLLALARRAAPATALRLLDLFRDAPGLVLGDEGRAGMAVRPGVDEIGLVDRLRMEIHGSIDPSCDYGAPTRGQFAWHVDTSIAVASVGLLLKGWLVASAEDQVIAARVRDMAGGSYDIDLPLPRLARPDVIQALAPRSGDASANCGFVALARIPGIDEADPPRFLEIESASGLVRRHPLRPKWIRDVDGGIQAVVALAELTAVDLADLFARAIAPPLDALWAKRRSSRRGSDAIDFGERADRPLVSVIVPIYGRSDFIRHQIASFSNDPEFRAGSGCVELIYVVDDPRIQDETRRLCGLLEQAYDVPFRLLPLGENHGYSAANNRGAAVARGRYLLLLNSDVFPRRPRWLGQLVRAYENLETCGTVGPRLLFADGSIQHAGMRFRPSRHIDGCWTNEHPCKGMPTSLDPHVAPAVVPAVTGACLLISRGLYDAVGGLTETYVIGDFEDSDLCLKVRSRGLLSYYVPGVELYHAERQSMQLIGQGEATWRQSLTLFNMWRHAETWRTQLAALQSVAAI